MKASKLFEAAPRKSSEFDVNGVKATLIEPSLKDRVDWSEIAERKGKDSEYIYGFLLSRCCFEFKGVDIQEIIEKLDPEVLMSMGTAILELVEKKKG